LTYIRKVLSVIAVIIAALLVPGLIVSVREISSQRQTGLGVVVGGLFSPIFWLLAVGFFALFFLASRISNRTARILLFWTPALAITIFGFCLFFLFAYAWFHFKHG
jgi:hypothetical protein